MHHATGFDREEIIDLCIRMGAPNWPPCLGLFKSAAATLTCMRHNRTRAEIGESLGVSQPTVSFGLTSREEEHLAWLNLGRAAKQSFKGSCHRGGEAAVLREGLGGHQDQSRVSLSSCAVAAV